MKQIAVISGKGGTGKTTFAAMGHLMVDVVADCDVDAPNMHIILNPRVIESEDFFSSKKAVIDADKCVGCGLCYELCRFDAVKKDSDVFFVDDKRCEGCAFCYNACEVKAIEMVEAKTGEVYISETKWGNLVHAMLKPGEENTGKLVTEVRKRAEKVAGEKGSDLIIIDSPPGIGCPVMASLTNVNAALVVTEPTASAMSDLQRIIDLCRHFRIKTFVAINKYDLNDSVTSKIEEFCDENGIEVVATIPFDEKLIEQISNLSFPFSGKAAEGILKCWENLIENL